MYQLKGILNERITMKAKIFFIIADNSVVVLTHGFIKKSQKTPKSEIERAESYRKDFLKRRLKHE
ncbi:MAG: type II toxin-antitoxin system RelE/ParE family toxin [Nitrospinota bacterium]